ncbi:Small-conductance mechanosensitive channel [Rubripirellula lacrimiformis]|uniref:Small-conductance mechanosensitive channel n=1 Tax=Rubripirellula lacrimiformis TaxID=1930273 RepID=A0A517NLF0_9BACT|nr:mechanosensitive ion channel domain-containing protein [Rubripirellula lacrimiformis]QDT07909.1 Small-conductance mechanosensitive channel [Rubripirellula lacrimiformis]
MADTAEALTESGITESGITDPSIQEQSIADATDNMITKLTTEGDYTVLTDYAANHLAPSLFWAAVGLTIIFVGYLCAKYISRLISRPVCKRVDETLGRFIGKMVFYCIMFGITGAVLSKLGAPLGGLAAMLAAAGFAIGLAFQGTLSNFASGVLMLVFRPFKVGDVVNAGGVMGKVNEIDLFTTTLDTPDNRRIIVPNSSISSGTIENITFHAHRRVEVLVGVDYAADLDQTRAALENAIAQFSMATIQGEGRGGQVVLASLGDSAVNWKVRLWVAAANFWPVTESLTGEVKRQLDAAKISIPFPQLDVHINRDDEESVSRTRVRPARREISGTDSQSPLSRAS